MSGGLTGTGENGSATEDVKFLQIWVFLRSVNIKPRYDQKLYPASERENKFKP